MTRIAITTLAAILAAAVLATGCATPPAPEPDAEPAQHQVLDHKCENGAVTALLIGSTGKGVFGFQWSNKAICGESV